jgi:hypothetical protein
MLLELELWWLLAPDLPYNCSSLRDLNYTHSKGIQILTNWLNAQIFEKACIPTSLKNQVPEAHTTTQALPLEVLTNESGNSVCISAVQVAD